MSLKPEKKSDMNKAWKRSRRDRARLISPEYHLIVTEGTKTEPQYFRSISEVINQKYHDKIQLEIHGERKDTLRLLDKAVSRVQNSIKVFKHVWIVYDTDDFPPERINQTAEECKRLTTDETIIMRFGLISVSSFGSCFISTLSNPICIVRNISPS